jgi:hypothetical protein
VNYSSESSDLAAYARRQRPENEVPVSVAVDAVLLAAPDAAVLLGAVQAFSTGIAFTVTVLTRRIVGEGVSGALHRHGGTDPLLLGVEYADGRSASTVTGRHMPPADPASDALTLWPGGGSGGTRYADASFFLAPLPPAGPVRFVAAWPALGLAETVTEVPAGPILAAAAQARQLWPWEPEPELPVPVLDLPPGGWFERQAGER